MSVTAVPDQSTTFNGLIVEALPRRLRPIINAWVIGAGALTTARRLRNYVRNRTEYVVKIGAGDSLYDDVQAWLLESIPPHRRRSIRVRSGSRSDIEAVPDGPGPRRMPSTPALRLGYDGGVPQHVKVDGHRVEVRVDTKDWNYTGGRSAEYQSFVDQYTTLTLVAHTVAGQTAVLTELARLADARRESKRAPRLWIGTRWGSFQSRSDLAVRHIDSVVLRAGLKEELLADLTSFLASEADYARVGLPWHRGYLFHGPPGTGKTSLAQALATALDLDVYWVPLADVEDDSTFVRMLGEIQPRSILVLEDVDVIHATRDRDDTPGKLTMQGLLNGLDGLVTPHGLVVCLTTNRRDVLDDAVVRAGRVDREFEIDLLAGDDLRRLVEALVGPVDGCTFEAPRVPADVVALVKPHLRDNAAMRSAIKAEFAT